MARLLTPEETSGSGFLESVSEFGSGVAEGVKRDPFVALALKGLSEIEGADPEGLRELEHRAGGSTAAQFGKIVGEFGPTLLFGIPTAGATALVGRAAVQGVANQSRSTGLGQGL
jgi:hypothetical protein